MWIDYYENKLQDAKGDSITLYSIIEEALDDKQISDDDFNVLYDEALNLGL